MLPALEPSARNVIEVIDDQLFIDFVPTGLKLTGVGLDRPTITYPVRDGRLVFRIAGTTRVWDPRTRTLSDLPVAAWVPVAGHGWIFQTYPNQNTVEWHDIDPDRTGPARFRVVHRATKDPGRNYLWAGIAGVLDGTIVAISVSRDFDTEKHRNEPRIGTIACIAGKGDVTTNWITLSNDVAWAGTDAIRDHRLLLVLSGNGGNGFEEWSTDMLVLDLDRDRMRTIGKAQGGYTTCTAVPHPHIEVRWGDDRTSHREPDVGGGITLGCNDGGSNRVEPATESINGFGPTRYQALNFSGAPTKE